MTYKQYQRKQIAEMADWHEGFDMAGVSVSDADKSAGSPKLGDKIARNPKNHADRWLVAADYFADNFSPLRSLDEKALPEEPEYCDADGYILQSNNQKPVFVKKAAYDALRAHAAALQAERDAMRGEIYALRKYGNKDCTAMADAALAELRSAAIDVARGKK